MTVETTLPDVPARDLSPQAALQVGLTLEALIRDGGELHPADAAIKRAEKIGKLGAIFDSFPALREALSEALATTTQGRSVDAAEAARRLNALDADGEAERSLLQPDRAEDRPQGGRQVEDR